MSRNLTAGRRFKKDKSSADSGNVESKFIDTVSRLGMSMGLNRVVGQIYGLLYFRNKPLSLDDIAESLKVSKGNVSVNIRELENWGAVKTVWVPGSRRDYYEANTDVLGVIYKRIRLRLEKTISELGANLAVWEAADSLPDEFKSRLKDIAAIRDALQEALGILPSEISGGDITKKIAMLSKLKSIL